MRSDFRVERQQYVPSPRIDGKPVHVDLKNGEARYYRAESQPRHPSAAYSIPDRYHPGWRIDVILFLSTVIALGVAALCLFA